MENREYHQPPRIWLAFFRWYCRPEFLEEIEGDLLERFHDVVERQGIRQARSVFAQEVLLLFRPMIIGNFRRFTFNLIPAMKTLPLCFALC